MDGNQKFKPLEFKFTNENAPKSLGPINSEGLLSLTYLKKWKKAKKAILFRMSNKIIQVVF